MLILTIATVSYARFIVPNYGCNVSLDKRPNVGHIVTANVSNIPVKTFVLWFVWKFLLIILSILCLYGVRHSRYFVSHILY